jgi:enoyl-CoA hydratase
MEETTFTVVEGHYMEMIKPEWLEADEAYRTGLVNHVVPQAKFLKFCSGIAQK